VTHEYYPSGTRRKGFAGAEGILRQCSGTACSFVNCEIGGESRQNRPDLHPGGPEFDGAYHFAFNIPENQIRSAKEWLMPRTVLLKDEQGNDYFQHSGWNSEAVYFKDPAGNILEFIARHDLSNAVDGDFDSSGS
jgi:hypothetical protein